MTVIKRAPDDVHRTSEYEALVASVRTGNCVVFVGSGLSATAYISWNALVQRLCDACGVPYVNPTDNDDPTPLLQMADQARVANQLAYCQVLGDEFGKTIVSTRQAYHLIAQLPFSSFVTINFDPLLHSARVSTPIGAGCPFQVRPTG
jgi:hypothetical protein